ncbi:tyrosine-protein kinase receptor torso isoform X1 [Dendroctonus ponderosae]|uniref:tyrosine-protein kinase receptor torso isoform X1 n=1 Tax=Dendroctonus ponderosae TaxID=77166 RepID=UPI0020351E1F|nr:tyrosine-protein kinase receptor torso isoform X1 [Dendroctonus ponderosae]
MAVERKSLQLTIKINKLFRSINLKPHFAMVIRCVQDGRSELFIELGWLRVYFALSVWNMFFKCFVILVGGFQQASALKVCLDCLQDIPANGCVIESSYPAIGSCLHSFDLEAAQPNSLQAPNLVCREESSMTFSWQNSSGLYYFLQYLQASNQAMLTNLTNRNTQTIYNLIPHQEVLVSLYAAAPSKELWQKSPPVEVRPLETLKRTPVQNLNVSLNYTGQGYNALISWKPGSDMSCYYEMVWYGKRQPGDFSQRRLSLKQALEPQFLLPDLELGRQYHYSIASTDGSGRLESPKRYLKISVPSCLQTFRNLSVCAPSKPSNFTALNLPASGLQLSWARPSLLPLFYSIDFSSRSSTASVNSSGEATSLTLRNVSLGDQDLIKLVAHSRAGASPPAYTRGLAPISNNYSSMEKESGGLLMWSLMACGVALVGVLVIWRVLARRMPFEEGTSEPAVRYTTTEAEDSKWELVESKLLVDRVIGCGAFGIVQKGFYYLEPNKKTPVAIKTLKVRPTPEQLAQFYDEIDIMKSVPYHTNIVFLFGVVTKHRPSNPLMLVEYCAKGDLHTYLKNVAFVLQSNSPAEQEKCADQFFNKCYDLDLSGKENLFILEAKDLLSFARQIAVGMVSGRFPKPRNPAVFLQEFLSNLKMIHRDLAARNVLISENNILKISDFGLSRDIYTDNVYRKVTGGKLPFKWMALESLTHQVYTTESDVWSFGIVLWEIITLGENPYPVVNTEDLVALLKEGYRMECPINCSQELQVSRKSTSTNEGECFRYNTMLDCWESSPNLRPSFRQLRETFDRLLESEVQYINLKGAWNLEWKRYENVDPDLRANLDGSNSYMEADVVVKEVT